MWKKNISNRKIPLTLYKKIISHMPICCVDIVFKVDKKVYLFKRAYEPAKNKWWLIGGRVLKGESLREAVIRKVKEEVGIDVKILKKIGVYETFFYTNRFDTKKKKSGTHSISICFVVEPKNRNFTFKLNEEYLKYKIIKSIYKNLNPYVIKVLRDSEVI
jgi:colanic acid biosynthesis protein WcaH